MLSLAWMCGQYHLPDDGGILEQDFAIMRQMRVLDNVYQAVKRTRAAKGAEIHNLPVEILRTIAWLKKEGLY